MTIEARQGLALARTGETVWAGAFKNHIRTFGWYNVLGTVNYAMHGDGRRAVALGTATVGTLMGSYSTELGLAKWLGRAGGPIATGLVLAGSAGLAGVDAWDQHKSAIRTEPYNERFLILSGLDPDIAAALSSNDGEGRGIGPKLEQVAEHLQVAPDALMDWVVQQDPQWVKRFAKSVGHIHVNGDGSLQERELPPNYGYYSGGGYPRSLQGLLRLNSALRDWAEQNEAPQ